MADHFAAPQPVPQGPQGRQLPDKIDVFGAHDMVVADDGDTVVVVGDGIVVASLATGEEHNHASRSFVTSVAMTRTRPRPLVATASNYELVVHSLEGNRLQRVHREGSRHQMLAFNSTDSVLASASFVNALQRGVVTLWDVGAATGALTQSGLGGGGSLLHPNGIGAMAWSPIHEAVLATGCWDGRVRLFDVRAGAGAVAEFGAVGIGYEHAVSCLAFDPSGQTLAAGYHDGQVSRSDARAPHAAVGAPINAHDGWVYCMQYSLCGRVLATGGHDRMVKLWDATGSELVALVDDPVLPKHIFAISGLDFNPSDPSSLVSCSLDGMVRRWSVPECALGLPFEGPSPPDTPQKTNAMMPAVGPERGGN